MAFKEEPQDRNLGAVPQYSYGRGRASGRNRTHDNLFTGEVFCQLNYRSVVAGEGFEPTTSGLWAQQANQLLYPAI